MKNIVTYLLNDAITESEKAPFVRRPILKKTRKYLKIISVEEKKIDCGFQIMA
jgi:hypothetical protein